MTLDRRGPTTFLAAALATGALAAAALPGERLGLGVLLVALALAGCGALVAREGDQWTRAWAALAVLLAASAVVRDATWVVLPALAGALLLGSLAVAGGTSWRQVAVGAGALAARAPLGSAVLARAVRAAVPADGAARVAPVARGAVLACGLLVVFGALFASADEAFAELAGEALPTGWDVDRAPERGAAFVGALSLAGGLALARGTGVAASPAAPARVTLGAVEWLVGLAALNLLFAAFVGVQLATLFGDDDHVLRTSGLTYADYAHEGFGQLLVVAALTLGVIGAALRFGPSGARVAVRALLAVLVVLTFVVLASALHRLDLYLDAYGWTRLRVAAGWALVLVGALLAVALGGVATNRLRWIPRAAVLTVAAALLALVAADPDRRIAEASLDRAARGATIDASYLRSLSADAAPALPARLAPPPPGRDGWGGWNLARFRAR